MKCILSSFKDAKVLIDVSSKQTEAINSSSWPTDSKTAKIALKVHDDIRTEMNTRRIKENRINDLCRKLKEDLETVKNNIKDDTILVVPTNDQLNTIQNSLLSCVKETQNSWTKRQDRLNEHLQINVSFLYLPIKNYSYVWSDEKDYTSVKRYLRNSYV